MCFSFSLRMKNESCWNLFAWILLSATTKKFAFVFENIFMRKLASENVFMTFYAKANTKEWEIVTKWKQQKINSKIKISSKLIKHKTLTHTKKVYLRHCGANLDDCARQNECLCSAHSSCFQLQAVISILN